MLKDQQQYNLYFCIQSPYQESMWLRARMFNNLILEFTYVLLYEYTHPSLIEISSHFYPLIWLRNHSWIVIMKHVIQFKTSNKTNTKSNLTTNFHFFIIIFPLFSIFFVIWFLYFIFIIHWCIFWGNLSSDLILFSRFRKTRIFIGNRFWMSMVSSSVFLFFFCSFR